MIQTQYVFAADENPGLEAFKKTLYPFVRKNCVACHETVIDPYFASSDPAKAYQYAKTRVKFGSYLESKFISQNTNGHCGPNCMTDGKDITSLLKEWSAAEIAAGAKPDDTTSTSQPPTVPLADTPSAPSRITVRESLDDVSPAYTQYVLPALGKSCTSCHQKFSEVSSYFQLSQDVEGILARSKDGHCGDQCRGPTVANAIGLWREMDKRLDSTWKQSPAESHLWKSDPADLNQANVRWTLKSVGNDSDDSSSVGTIVVTAKAKPVGQDAILLSNLSARGVGGTFEIRGIRFIADNSPVSGLTSKLESLHRILPSSEHSLGIGSFVVPRATQVVIEIQSVKGLVSQNCKGLKTFRESIQSNIVARKRCASCHSVSRGDGALPNLDLLRRRFPDAAQLKLSNDDADLNCSLLRTYIDLQDPASGILPSLANQDGRHPKLIFSESEKYVWTQWILEEILEREAK